MRRSVTLGVFLLGAACSKLRPEPLKPGLYCEHGREAMGGDCMSVRPASGSDPKVIGDAVFKHRTGHASFLVRKEAPHHYSLYEGSKPMGQIEEHDGELRITINDEDGVYAKTMSAERGPGLFE